MNPLCQCGCRREVRLPQNKYVQGHSSYWPRQLTDEQVGIAKQMLAEGVSAVRVAQELGVSASIISLRVRMGSYVDPAKHSHTVVTQPELDHRFAKHMYRKANASLGRVRRTIKEISKGRKK